MHVDCSLLQAGRKKSSRGASSGEPPSAFTFASTAGGDPNAWQHGLKPRSDSQRWRPQDPVLLSAPPRLGSADRAADSRHAAHSPVLGHSSAQHAAQTVQTQRVGSSVHRQQRSRHSRHSRGGSIGRSESGNSVGSSGSRRHRVSSQTHQPQEMRLMRPMAAQQQHSRSAAVDDELRCCSMDYRMTCHSIVMLHALSCRQSILPDDLVRCCSVRPVFTE